MDVTTLQLNFGTSASTATGVATTQPGYAGVSGTITSGYTQGSTSIVVSSASGLSVGDILMIYQTNDPSFMFTDEGETNSLRQAVKITNISGTTITINPGLVFSFESSYAPSFRQYLGFWSNVGIENMTLDATNGFIGNIIWIDSTYSSWIRNVKTKNPYAGEHIFLTKTLFNEIRECWIAGILDAGAEGHGIYANQGTASYPSFNTSLLIEDNVFDGLWWSIALNNATGSVTGYNFSNNNYYPTTPSWQEPIINEQHGAHGMMNLWEGNIGQGLQSDGYHGSISHQTIFRNAFTGVNSQGYVYNRKLIDLTRFAYYHNIIGNVLGDPSWTPTWWACG